jgi:hypothetical protein
MPYIIRKMVLARTPVVDITKDEHAAVKPARAVINELIAVEEAFDAVMENYVELEQSVHAIATRHLAFVDRHYEEMAAPLNLISRRFANLLSSARLYRDALPQHAGRLFGRKHPAVDIIKQSLNDSASQPMPYRQMEAIRNYAQHVGPPIEDITFGTHRDVDENRQTTGVSYRVTPILAIEGVAKLRDMHDDVRASLIALGDQVNPIPILRQYVEHIGVIHRAFRESTKQLGIDSENTMRSLLDRYAKVLSGPQEATAVTFQNPNGSFSETEYLVVHRIDYFQYLRIKHLTSAGGLSIRYVPW